MIRADYFEAGFPVNKRIPIICFLKDNSFKVAYNYFELRQIIINNPVVLCLGIWGGKINTDVFTLNPETYKEVYPPELNKDIDDAEEITVTLGMDGDFQRLIYVIGKKNIESKDVILYNYIKKSNKKYRTTFE